MLIHTPKAVSANKNGPGSFNGHIKVVIMRIGRGGVDDGKRKYRMFENLLKASWKVTPRRGCL